MLSRKSPLSSSRQPRTCKRSISASSRSATPDCMGNVTRNKYSYMIMSIDESVQKQKKYKANFIITRNLTGAQKYKIVHFGDVRVPDFTVHKNKDLREEYIQKHFKRLEHMSDFTKPVFLDMFLLWNKPDLNAALRDYNYRLDTYNKTGVFPLQINGSLKMSQPAISLRESLRSPGSSRRYQSGKQRKSPSWSKKNKSPFYVTSSKTGSPLMIIPTGKRTPLYVKATGYVEL